MKWMKICRLSQTGFIFLICCVMSTHCQSSVQKQAETQSPIVDTQVNPQVDTPVHPQVDTPVHPQVDKQVDTQLYPRGLILHYSGKGGVVDLETPFNVSCIDRVDTEGLSLKTPAICDCLHLKPEQIQRVGTPSDGGDCLRIPLSQFSMADWKGKTDAALCLSNSGKKPLHVTLPKEITIPLFISGDNVIVNGHSTLQKENVFIGIDGRYLGNILVSGCFFYTDGIVPSTVTINGSLNHALWYIVARSELTLNGPVPNRLFLHHSRVKASFSDQKILDGELNFYGECDLHCAQTKRITGNIILGSDEQPFSTERSLKPNNGIARLRNVVFEPKKIFIEIPMVKNHGFFDVKGPVHLSHTCIDVDSYDLNSVIGKRFLIINSDRPIKSKPKQVSVFCDHDPNVVARCEIKGNKVYLVISKDEKLG